MNFMKEILPNPDEIFPLKNYDKLTYVKPTVKNPNIIVGDFTYFSDRDFENQVIHHYDFYGDKLIIGKFCQIASGVTFVMNGANHQMNCASTYPFYIFEGWGQKVPPLEMMPIKGNIVIENDVWIGQNAVILPGVHISNGAIVGMNSVVGSDVPPYTIVAGNPAREIRKRFDSELTQLLLKLKWWDREISEIKKIIPILTSNDFEYVKSKIKEIIFK